MGKNSKLLVRSLLLLCLTQFPLVSWAQANSVWVQPLEQCWLFDSEQMTSLKVASDNDSTIVLPNSDGELIGIDLRKGKTIWKTTVGETFDSEIRFNGQNILVSGSKLSELSAESTENTTSRSTFSIDLNSGIASLLASESIRQPVAFISIVSQAEIILTVAQNGKIQALNQTTKEILWQRHLDMNILTEAKIDGNAIIFGTSNRTVLVLSLDTGEILSQIPVGEFPSFVTPIGTVLYIGDKLGNVRAVDSSSQKEIWRTKTGGEISEIVSFEDLILVSSNDNYEYAILKKTGKKIWKRKLAGRILGKALIGEKILAVFAHGSNSALFLDLSNGAIVNRIDLEKTNYFVSAPLFLNDILIVPTNDGLIAYSPNKCSANTG